MILTVCMITISVVLFIHLGLSEIVQRIIRIRVQPLNCSKCLNFWFVLSVLLYNKVNFLQSIGVAFSTSYIALWLELLLGYLSTLYDRLYGKVYTSEDDTTDKTD